MALIKCDNCGKEISDKATNCVHCGKKLNTKKSNMEKPIKKLNKKSIFIIGGILLIIIIVSIIIFLFLNHDRKNYIGKWERNITWKQGDEITGTSYSYIELLENGTFVFYESYSSSEETNNINGTYNENNGIIYIYFRYDDQDNTGVLYIDDNKLCINEKNCIGYYVKSSSKDENTHIINEEPTYTSAFYEEYQNILNNKENAIVVFGSGYCRYCREYKEILDEVDSNYSTPIYYYELEAGDVLYDALDISATPTTHIIKNGVNVETIVGKKEYDELSEILDRNNIK